MEDPTYYLSQENVREGELSPSEKRKHEEDKQNLGQATAENMMTTVGSTAPGVGNMRLFYSPYGAQTAGHHSNADNNLA